MQSLPSRVRMRRHLGLMENSLTAGFALLLLLLAVSYHVNQNAIREAERSQRAISEAQGTRIEILALLKSYADAETGQRGFLLTGDEKYLEPYKRTQELLGSGKVRLKSVLAPIEQLREMRARVNPDERARLTELERIIEVRRSQGLGAAIDEMKKETGKAVMDSMREVLDAYDEQQHKAIESLFNQTERRRHQVSLVSTIAFVILGAALIGLFALTHRNLAERERLLKITQDAKDALQKSLAAERVAHSAASHANKLKDEFIAVVSHELRTPLNAIVGWTSLLREGAEDEKELQEGLETIDRNAHAQARLVDDLLDVSRIVTGKVRLQIAEVNLRAVVASVVDGLKPAAAARGVELNVAGTPEPLEVLGDSDRLQQVTWNLLNNAIKFTPRGGRVQVSLEQFDSRVVLEVKDNGQGIKAAFLPHIFERFSQQDTSTSRGQAGLGLGLAITRHLVELHGGKIRVRSAGENQGATFRVEIPIVGVRELKKQLALRKGGNPANAEARSELPDDVLKNLRVLAVDDQADTLTVIERVLHRAGADVRTSTSVDEALNILRDWPAELVISDIGMPMQDGYCFVRELREHPNSSIRELRAIALTAFAREQDRQEALDAGFNEHLSKPVEAATLLEKVAHVSGRA